MPTEIKLDNQILLRWNDLDSIRAANEILPCCGSKRWAELLAQRRPFFSAHDLSKTSDEIWHSLEATDWDEAFSSHPRIGESRVPASATAQSAQWSSEEQATAFHSALDMRVKLEKGNDLYEQRFGRTYIVCATGKSLEEMLAILDRRLKNDKNQELVEATEQQRQITQIRLKKWLQL